MRPWDAEVPVLPWDDEGVARERIPIVTRGKVEPLLEDRIIAHDIMRADYLLDDGQQLRLFEAALGPQAAQPWSGNMLAAMLVASVLLAWLGFVLVERPVLRWRHRLRQRGRG